MSIPPRIVGHYEIIDGVAQTTHSRVYRARHLNLGRLDALKELSIFGDDSVARQRFLDEARLAAQLSHPNVVTVHDYFEADGSAWIAMEYFPSGTLAPHAGTLSAAQVAGVADSVLAALEEAQRHAIVHRDLKPQNLMVTPTGDTKVADFGIAKALDDARPKLTSEGQFVGTLVYAAPETVRGQETTPVADQYSLAVVCHELLRGSWPFNDSASPAELVSRKAQRDLPSLRGKHDLPDGVAEFFARLGRRDPGKRFATAADARAALRDAAVDAWGPGWRAVAAITDLDPKPPPPPPDPERSGSRFGSYATVTSVAKPGRLLERAAMRPFNLLVGLVLIAGTVWWKPEAIWIGVVAYLGLVALSFFDVQEAERTAPPRHARSKTP